MYTCTCTYMYMHVIHVFYKCRLTCSWRLKSVRVGAARQPEGVRCYPSLHSGGEGLIRQLDTVATEDLKRLIQRHTHTRHVVDYI